jgi:hypothetical protein
MLITEDALKDIIYEELTKSEVSSIISSKIGDSYNSREFKKKVKELAADVVSEIFKILWQRNSFWKSSAAN